jgi:transcriptional regulator with XRE-family HTH domain
MSNATVTQRIAATVRAEAARRQITQAHMAEKLGRSQTFVSRRLLGRVPFSIDELDQLAEILAVPLAELIGAAPTP